MEDDKGKQEVERNRMRELRRLGERKSSFARSLEEFLSRKYVEHTLMAIVMDDRQCEAFRLFLRSRLMEDGLNLLISVLDYEMRPSFAVAQAIFNKFLQPEAEESLAIDGTRKPTWLYCSHFFFFFQKARPCVRWQSSSMRK